MESPGAGSRRELTAIPYNPHYMGSFVRIKGFTVFFKKSIEGKKRIAFGVKRTNAPVPVLPLAAPTSCVMSPL